MKSYQGYLRALATAQQLKQTISIVLSSLSNGHWVYKSHQSRSIASEMIQEQQNGQSISISSAESLDYHGVNLLKRVCMGDYRVRLHSKNKYLFSFFLSQLFMTGSKIEVLENSYR